VHGQHFMVVLPTMEGESRRKTDVHIDVSLELWTKGTRRIAVLELRDAAAVGQPLKDRREPFSPLTLEPGTPKVSAQTKPSPVRYRAKDLKRVTTKPSRTRQPRAAAAGRHQTERRRNPPPIPFVRLVDRCARRSGPTKTTQVDRAPRSTCEPARASAAAPPPPLGPRSAAVVPR
jgi:hypothetical protein